MTLARRALGASLAGLLLGLTLAALLLLGPWTPARAQGLAPSNVLAGVSVVEAGPGQTRVLLTFAPHSPKFSVINNDSDHPAIAFGLSTRGPSAAAPLGGRGLVRAIDFDQNDTILVLKFHAGSTVKLDAKPVSDQVLAVTLTATGPASPSTSETEAAGPGGALPPAAERPPGEDDFEVVPLKYADVSEVVGLLTDGLTVKPNDTFIPREPAFGSASVNGGSQYSPPPPNEGAAEPVAQSVDQAIAIDRRLNAIILKGSPDQIARLKARIAEIDVPVESVILETIFVELTQSGAKNVGLDFNNANNQIGVATYQLGAFVPPGFPGHPLASAQLQAAIYAQVQKGEGRIVSKPRIAAQSGGSAKIITGDALPILTAITLSGVNGVSQQVQYVNVGVTLQIAPRVSSDGFVTSHVFCVVSSVTGFSQGYPTISQREAETSATVRDGETFVIGGLTEENDLSTKGRVPVLGDVPVAGELFKLEKSTRSKTELYIVVTPHVVRRGEPAALPPDAQAGG